MLAAIIFLAAAMMSFATALPYSGKPIYGRADAGVGIPIGSPNGFYVAIESPEGGYVWEYHGEANNTEFPSLGSIVEKRNQDTRTRTIEKRGFVVSDHCDGLLNNAIDGDNAAANLFHKLEINPWFKSKVAYTYGTAVAFGCNYDNMIQQGEPFASTTFINAFAALDNCAGERQSAGWQRTELRTVLNLKYISAEAYGRTDNGLSFC